MFDELHPTPDADLVADLAGTDVRRLSAEGRVQFVVDCERAVAWIQSMQAQAMAGVVSDTQAWLSEVSPVNVSGRLINPLSGAGDEIASALDISSRAGTNRVAHAVELTESLPMTFRALQSGVLSLWQTRMVADELREVPATSRRTIEATVVGRVMTGSLRASGLRRALRVAAERLQPTLPKDRHAAALRNRGVSLFSMPNGMACLSAVLKASHAISVFTTLERLASETASAGDELDRSLDNLRADWLCYLVSPLIPTDDAGVVNPMTGATATGATATCAGALGAVAVPSSTSDGIRSGVSGPGGVHVCRPVVRVTLDLPTALGLADHPGDLDGLGPIPASLARELATEGGDWERWITQPQTGELLDVAPQRYTPSDKLAAFIRHRDRTCRVPGCSRLAKYCDIDHETPFDFANPSSGGQTTRAGTGLLCRRHHLLKTAGAWKLRVREDRTAEWTSPTGRAYSEPPYDHANAADRTYSEPPHDHANATDPAHSEPPYDHANATEPLVMTEELSRLEVWLSGHLMATSSSTSGQSAPERA